MRLSVTGRHLPVSDAVRRQIERRLKPLERLLDASGVSAQCVFWQERTGFVCELTLHARGDHRLHGEGRAARLPAAVNAAFAKVGQQAQKLKDRWKTRKRSGPPVRAAAPGPGVAAAAPAAPMPRVIRSRPGEVKPMSLDDAILVLSDGQQAFLVYRDSASDRVAILYRRADGHFGLIEPEP